MKQLLKDIKALWRCNWLFKGASLYLFLLFILVLVLPWLPLPYEPNYLDLSNTFLPPLTQQAIYSNHILGTDGLGRDLLANLLYGARSALFISIPVMAVATTLGLGIGTGAGFYADKGLRLPRHQILLVMVGLAAMGYYGILLPAQITKLDLSYTYMALSWGVLFAAVLLVYSLSRLLSRFGYWKKSLPIPIDWLVLRCLEGINTIPGFVLILVLAAFMPPSVPLLAVLLILTSWPASARLARAEMLRVKQLPYFEAARSIGTPPKLLIWKHALPNLLGPVLVVFTYGLGGILTLESTLSFLNIGLPSSFVSWGRTISNIRTNTSAWWLIALPGGFLTLTVLAIYTCSYLLTKNLNFKRGN